MSTYAALLTKWQKAINLVGSRTIADVWRRHMLDSAQLFPLLPKDTKTLVDLGSGAGFPGLVLAMMGVPDVHLVESDHRKAAFLTHVSRETNTDVTVHAKRIETMPSLVADVVTARALAPLPKLLDLAERFVGPDSACLFLKGQDVDSELTKITKSMKMDVERMPSVTAPSATILRLRGLIDRG
ncbi:MAG: 16S rRNA (guanine(527)-N(7))-methyltransferase RsmG [Pseudomonadota bacterium]